MASSSSAKKVARVAARGSGGANAKKQANWLFPVAIVAIVALGVGAVLYARGENSGAGDNSKAPKANLANGEPFDHWHASFAVNLCGTELPAANDVQADILGIHTHGDGLIHIHPFATRASGDRATMGRFLDQVGITATDEGFSVPEAMAPDGETTVKEGETTCGGEEGEVVLAHWTDARTASSSEPDRIITSDFGAEKLSEDFGAYTLAFVVKGDRDIDPPSSSAQIEQLGSVDGGSTSSDAPAVGTEPTDGDGSVPPGEDPGTVELPTETTVAGE